MIRGKTNRVEFHSRWAECELDEDQEQTMADFIAFYGRDSGDGKSSISASTAAMLVVATAIRRKGGPVAEQDI